MIKTKRYMHGGDIYNNRISLDFSVNINPFGPPRYCLEELQDITSLLSVYPEIGSRRLCEAMAGFLCSRGINLTADNILFGNGAAELIYLLPYALDIKNAVSVAPVFTEYESAVRAKGGNFSYFNSLEELLEGLYKNRGTKRIDAVFLCNPNNPTGELTDAGILEKIYREAKSQDILFIIDECFIPFVKDGEKLTMAHRLEREGNNKLIVLGAFTKIFSLAGLRLGFMLSDTETVCKLREKIQPWNVSAIAGAAGIAALDVTECGQFIERTVSFMESERAYVINELNNIPDISIIGNPLANYIMFKGPADLKERLMENKILIRECSDFVGLKSGTFRIAIKKHEENMQLIEGIKACCKQIESIT